MSRERGPMMRVSVLSRQRCKIETGAEAPAHAATRPALRRVCALRRHLTKSQNSPQPIL